MTFSIEQVHSGLQLLSSNKRYYSPKALAAQSGFPVELINSLIDVLPTLSLVKLKLTPGGKFVSFTMTYNAKGFAFILPNRVWYNGRLVESNGNSIFDQRTFANHRRYYENKAATEGIRCIGYLDVKALAAVVFDALYPNHEQEIAKASLEDSLKHLYDYPDALARVRELMALADSHVLISSHH